MHIKKAPKCTKKGCNNKAAMVDYRIDHVTCPEREKNFDNTGHGSYEKMKPAHKDCLHEKPFYWCDEHWGCMEHVDNYPYNETIATWSVNVRPNRRGFR